MQFICLMKMNTYWKKYLTPLRAHAQPRPLLSVDGAARKAGGLLERVQRLVLAADQDDVLVGENVPADATKPYHVSQHGPIRDGAATGASGEVVSMLSDQPVVVPPPARRTEALGTLFASAYVATVVKLEAGNWNVSIEPYGKRRARRGGAARLCAARHAERDRAMLALSLFAGLGRLVSEGV